MMANNETGVIQPVAEVAAAARRLGAVMHVDAVQAPGRLAIDFAALGADAMVLSAHKLGGPRGVGALIIRDGVALTPFIKGGGQERRRRGGTENVAGIAGFGAAAAALRREAHAVARISRLRDMLEDGVARLTPAAVIVGREAPRVANTACIALPGKPAETLVIKLDLDGHCGERGCGVLVRQGQGEPRARGHGPRARDRGLGDPREPRPGDERRRRRRVPRGLGEALQSAAAIAA